LTGLRDDHFCFRKLFVEFELEPFDGGPVAVHKEDLFRTQADGVIQEAFAVGMGAEVEFLDLTI